MSRTKLYSTSKFGLAVGMAIDGGFKGYKLLRADIADSRAWRARRQPIHLPTSPPQDWSTIPRRVSPYASHRTDITLETIGGLFRLSNKAVICDEVILDIAHS